MTLGNNITICCSFSNSHCCQNRHDKAIKLNGDLDLFSKFIVIDILTKTKQKSVAMCNCNLYYKFDVILRYDFKTVSIASF